MQSLVNWLTYFSIDPLLYFHVTGAAATIEVKREDNKWEFRPLKSSADWCVAETGTLVDDLALLGVSLTSLEKELRAVVTTQALFYERAADEAEKIITPEAMEKARDEMDRFSREVVNAVRAATKPKLQVVP